VIFLTRNLVRTVELDGSTDNVETVWNNLTASMGLDRASYRMTGAFIGTKIQLREPFIVTVTVPYELDVFGAHGRAASLNFTLKSSLQGLSEVYWKDDEL
jgi:hypothetical protein